MAADDAVSAAMTTRASARSVAMRPPGPRAIDWTGARSCGASALRSPKRSRRRHASSMPCRLRRRAEPDAFLVPAHRRGELLVGREAGREPVVRRAGLPVVVHPVHGNRAARTDATARDRDEERDLFVDPVRVELEPVAF